ncbi:sporulation membrane protein YtaF [Salibacterium halotolerans]|uniref:Putative sporulation protein YtaF n=1 Tax=Salibacterium halotolerans TaxID=1884432 RepID=A0A1I5VFF7_9BACI|nr:sporulation membrane protein YtaF [Salibacterium halotolerans]SFQ06220.1 putative sporulation protein YtaF [Salibacterium halotolerans]
MASLFSLCVLAFAVSVDSFGAGLSYGLRRLKLPFYSYVCISVCSALSVLGGGAAAGFLKQYLPDWVTEAAGGLILILIGLWAVIQVFREQDTSSQSYRIEREKGAWKQFLTVLRKPDEADWDHSGTISVKEAVFLGAALSLDALGAGMGAALLGFSPFYLAGAVGFMCAVFLSLGRKGGRILAGTGLTKQFSFLPGILLIGMGLWNLQ